MSEVERFDAYYGYPSCRATGRHIHANGEFVLASHYDALAAELEAIKDIAAQDDADTAIDAVRKLKEYADQIEWSEVYTSGAYRSLKEELDEYKRRLDAVVVLCEECDPAMNSYYLISCPCGWKGSSSECDGGESIGDSGDWSDIECPACKRQDPPTLHASAVAIAEGRDNG